MFRVNRKSFERWIRTAERDADRLYARMERPSSRCATCGHSYRFHQEHWPACKGFMMEGK